MSLIDTLCELPVHLIKEVISKLKTNDFYHFINNENFIQIFEEYNLIDTLDLIDEEKMIWNLLGDNKFYNWVKIIYNANDKNYYYKQYKAITNITLHLTGTPEQKYITKLKMGLLLLDCNIYHSYLISKSSFNNINSLYKTIKDSHYKYNLTLLYYALIKDNNISRNCRYGDMVIYNNNFLEIASKMNKILNHYQFNKFYEKIAEIACRNNFERVLLLLNNNVSFNALIELSMPYKYITDAYIDNYLKVRNELQLTGGSEENSLYIDADAYLAYNIRNKENMTNLINYTGLGIHDMTCIYSINHIQKNHRNLYYYMKINNLIYSYTVETWSNIRSLYNWHGEIIFEMFNKYTLKQQNQIRIKELMEQKAPNEIFYNYIEHNINTVYNYNNTYQNQNIQELLKAYYELTEEQFNTYKTYINMNFTHEQALMNAELN